MPKAGYLYVLTHPSDPKLYKIGVTTLRPEKRLGQHNSNHQEYAGRMVKETGQAWELKTFIEVPDPYWAEKVFWSATPYPLIPFRRGIEIEAMEWHLVEKGLAAAEKAGIRPASTQTKSVRNHDWMVAQLEGTGIGIIGRYRGLVARTHFQCERGHAFAESAGRLANSKRCPLCAQGCD